MDIHLWANEWVGFSTADLLDITAHQEAIAFIVTFDPSLSITFEKLREFLPKFKLLNWQQVIGLPKCEPGTWSPKLPLMLWLGLFSHRGPEHIMPQSLHSYAKRLHEENSSGTCHKLLAEFCAFEYFRNTKQAPLCLLGYYSRFESTE